MFTITAEEIGNIQNTNVLFNVARNYLNHLIFLKGKEDQNDEGNYELRGDWTYEPYGTFGLSSNNMARIGCISALEGDGQVFVQFTKSVNGKEELDEPQNFDDVFDKTALIEFLNQLSFDYKEDMSYIDGDFNSYCESIGSPNVNEGNLFNVETNDDIKWFWTCEGLDSSENFDTLDECIEDARTNQEEYEKTPEDFSIYCVDTEKIGKFGGEDFDLDDPFVDYEGTLSEL